MFFRKKKKEIKKVLPPRIAILGAGTTGIIQLLSCISVLHESKIDVIHDSKTKIFGIGESSTPQLADLISRSYNLSQNTLEKRFLGTIKCGVKWSGWGDQKNFMIPFMINKIGFHFDTTAFCDFFIETQKRNPNVNFIDMKVDDQTDLSKYDYVIDCRGGVEIDETYEASPLKTVNSALVYRRNIPGKWNYTVHLTHENGWMFGIPLSNRQTWGYLYDSDVTDDVTAENDIKKYFPGEQLDLIKYKWTPRYSKNIVDETGRYFRNGNRLFFFEPMHGLSNFYYTYFADQISASIFNGVNPNLLNSEYHRMIDGLSDSLAFHYQHGSKYESSFWKGVVSRSKERFSNTNYEKMLSQGNYDFAIGNLHALYDLTTIIASFKNDMLKYYDEKNIDVKYFNEEVGECPEI